MQPQVGQNAQLILGNEEEPLAAIVCYVHGPAEVSVAYLHETGHWDKHQFVPWEQPGQPSPQGIYARPVPEEGDVGVSPAAAQAEPQRQQNQRGQRQPERGREENRGEAQRPQGREPRGPQSRKMEGPKGQR